MSALARSSRREDGAAHGCRQIRQARPSPHQPPQRAGAARTDGDVAALGAQLASVVLVVHFSAVLAGAFGAGASSMLEQAAARAFSPYNNLVDQGYGYRYYAPEPGPTPVVTATLHYADGREEVVRLPTRGVWPRLRYQRQSGAGQPPDE